MNSYRYYRGADGECFCYAKDATRRCPYGDAAPVELREEAAALGLDLDKIFRKAHRDSLRQGTRTSIKHCPDCGAALELLGYAAWMEYEPEPVTIGPPELQQVVWSVPQPERKQLFGLKREAIAWAREAAAISRDSADVDRRSEADETNLDAGPVGDSGTPYQ